jgi:hypothetical protein
MAPKRGKWCLSLSPHQLVRLRRFLHPVPDEPLFWTALNFAQDIWATAKERKKDASQDRINKKPKLKQPPQFQKLKANTKSTHAERSSGLANSAGTKVHLKYVVAVQNANRKEVVSLSKPGAVYQHITDILQCLALLPRNGDISCEVRRLEFHAVYD